MCLLMDRLAGRQSLDEIETKLTSRDPKVLDACLNYVKELLCSEQDRNQTISSKATNILGFAGVIATLSIPLIDLISSIRTVNLCLSVALSAVYVVMLAAIFSTIWLAFGGRTRETMTVPDIDDIFQFQSLRSTEVKRKWLADLIRCYKSTIADVNRRVTNVYTAQERLAIAIILLLVLAGVAIFAKLLV